MTGSPFERNVDPFGLAVDLRNLCATFGCNTTGTIEGPFGEMFCADCAEAVARERLGINRKRLRQEMRRARRRNSGAAYGQRKPKKRRKH